MLTIERARADLHAVPLVVRVGLALIVLGGLSDVVAHGGVPAGAAGEHTAAQLSAHAVVFVGMVLVLAGVVVDAVRHARARHGTAPRSQQGGT